MYEIVTLGKNGLYMRDGVRYHGLKIALKNVRGLAKMGIDARVLPYRDICERTSMDLAVA